MKKLLQIASLMILVILMVSLTPGCVGENATVQKQKIGAVILMEGEEYHIPGTDYLLALRDASIYGTSSSLAHYQAIIDVYKEGQNTGKAERFWLDEDAKKATISNVEVTLVSSGDKSAAFVIYQDLG